MAAGRLRAHPPWGAERPRTPATHPAHLTSLAQFVAKRCTSGVVRAVDLATAQVGQKDMTKGAFAVWQDLLQKRVSAHVVVVVCVYVGVWWWGGGGA